MNIVSRLILVFLLVGGAQSSFAKTRIYTFQKPDELINNAITFTIKYDSCDSDDITLPAGVLEDAIETKSTCDATHVKAVSTPNVSIDNWNHKRLNANATFILERQESGNYSYKVTREK